MAVMARSAPGNLDWRPKFCDDHGSPMDAQLCELHYALLLYLRRRQAQELADNVIFLYRRMSSRAAGVQMGEAASCIRLAHFMAGKIDRSLHNCGSRLQVILAAVAGCIGANSKANEDPRVR